MLTQRQEKILETIIKEYTSTAIAVSSLNLAKKYNLECSTATLRNEMFELEERGYLVKPHISSGRIPTGKGYRYFVDNLMQQRDLSRDYQKKLEIELLKEKTRNARSTRTIAKLLSGMSQCLAISGLVKDREYYDFGMHELIEDPEFSSLDEISRISTALDLIDENVETLLKRIRSNETEIFIGQENPLKEIRSCSMVVSPYILDSGEKGIVAIIGPKRMKYGRNKGLVDLVRKILGRSVVVFIVTSLGTNAYLLLYR